jgi:hypothetical protein
MNEAGIYDVCTRLGIEPTGEVNGWIMASCPLAPWKQEHAKGYDNNPSFGISINDNDVSYYNCFTCKAKGTLGGLAMVLANYRDEPELREYGKVIDREEILGGHVHFGDWDDQTLTKKEKVTRIDTFAPYSKFLKRPSVFTSAAAISYLRRRRVTFDTVVATGLRFDPREKRILFPVFDYWTGNFVGCSGRTILAGDALKRLEDDTGRPQPRIRDYLGLPKDRVILSRVRNDAVNRTRLPRYAMGQPHNPNSRIGTYILVVEGLFAYLRLVQLGYGHSAAALLGSVVTEGKAEIFRDLNMPTYWLTDDDAAGYSCLHGEHDEEGNIKRHGALDMFYGEFPQFELMYPAGKTDPDELVGEELEQMIKNAELYIR